MHHYLIVTFFKVKDIRNLKILSNPNHAGARDILNERYGVSLPQFGNKHDQNPKVCTYYIC